jgi:hypothetical protein
MFKASVVLCCLCRFGRQLLVCFALRLVEMLLFLFQDLYIFVYLSLSIYLFMALQPFVEPWPLFQFRNPVHNR